MAKKMDTESISLSHEALNFDIVIHFLMISDQLHFSPQPKFYVCWKCAEAGSPLFFFFPYLKNCLYFYSKSISPSRLKRFKQAPNGCSIWDCILMFKGQPYGPVTPLDSFQVSFKYILYTLEFHCIYSELYKIPCNIQFTNRMHMIA